MLSKNLKSTLLILFMLSACQRFHQDEPKKQSTIPMPQKELHCLQGWPENVKKYFADELAEKQTAEIFTCLSQTLQHFEKFTKGESAQVYTKTELLHYLNRYMLKDRQISSSFMDQLMRLKSFVFGGRANQLSRAELHALVASLETLKHEALKLRGRIRTLLFTADYDHITEEELRLSQVLFKQSLHQFFASLQVRGSSYTWNDFEIFLVEFVEYFKDTGFAKFYHKWHAFLGAAKKVFVGDNHELKNNQELMSVFNWGFEIYEVISYFHYTVRFKQFSDSSYVAKLTSMIEKSLDLIMQSPQLARSGLLPAPALDQMIEELMKVESIRQSMGLNLSPDVIKNVFRNVVAHVLQGNRNGRIEGYAIRGIEMQDLEILKTEFLVWKLSQAHIHFAYEKKEFISHLEFRNSTAQFKASEYIATMKLGPDLSDTLLKSWNDWNHLLNTQHPLVFDREFRLIIPYHSQSQVGMNYASASGLNLIRSLIRFVFLAYGEMDRKAKSQKNVWDLILSKNKLMQFEEDFRVFGRAVKFLDPRTPNPAERTFAEGNYFTFSSNSDNKLNAVEMTELISILFAGGRVTTTELIRLAKEARCGTGELDILKEEIYDEKCFKAVFKINFSNVFSNLRDISTFGAKRPSVDQIYYQLMKLSALEEKRPDTIEYAEIRKMVVVLHYIEALFAVYDRNRSFDLDQTELSASFKRFRSKVIEMSPMKDTMAEAAYFYMIYRGSLPKIDGWVDSVKVGADFAKFHLFENIEPANRNQIFEVLNVLKGSR